MLISPDRPCEVCGSIYFDLLDDGRVCLDCGVFKEDIPLEEIAPGTTAKILSALAKEAAGEETD